MSQTEQSSCRSNVSHLLVEDVLVWEARHASLSGGGGGSYSEILRRSSPKTPGTQPKNDFHVYYYSRHTMFIESRHTLPTVGRLPGSLKGVPTSFFCVVAIMNKM